MTAQTWMTRHLTRFHRTLSVAGVVLFLVGFAWLWWRGVPALYGTAGEVGPADRLKATTDTRTALLAGLAALVHWAHSG
jgi:hypothetical protein